MKNNTKRFTEVVYRFAVKIICLKLISAATSSFIETYTVKKAVFNIRISGVEQCTFSKMIALN